MAQILIVNEKSKRDWNNLNDVVVIFNDDVHPTQKEIENYTIIKVPGNADEIKATMMNKVPKVELAWKDESDGQWKVLKEEPTNQCRYEGGEFKHNYGIKNTIPLSTISEVKEDGKTMLYK